ncbi:MAG: hypothetical protein JW963_14435 [Anaerolineales bacterium]|nr:hypothetical protein [Anaerolineales bacterium]
MRRTKDSCGAPCNLLAPDDRQVEPGLLQIDLDAEGWQGVQVGGRAVDQAGKGEGGGLAGGAEAHPDFVLDVDNLRCADDAQPSWKPPYF